MYVMVEMARSFLQRVEGKAITRLFAAALVLMSAVVAAEHDHHHDEEPVHAGGECILCSGGISGDGDVDALPSCEAMVLNAATDDIIAPVSPRAQRAMHDRAARVRGPPIGS